MSYCSKYLCACIIIFSDRTKNYNTIGAILCRNYSLYYNFIQDKLQNGSETLSEVRGETIVVSPYVTIYPALQKIQINIS